MKCAIVSKLGTRQPCENEATGINPCNGSPICKSCLVDYNYLATQFNFLCETVDCLHHMMPLSWEEDE